MENLQEKIDLVIKGKKYEVTFPNVGQLRKIASNKALLSNGMYRSIYTMATEEGDQALKVIDVEAIFSVLIPDLITELKPGSIGDLGLKDFKEIEKVYDEQFTPWFDAWMKVLKS